MIKKILKYTKNLILLCLGLVGIYVFNLFFMKMIKLLLRLLQSVLKFKNHAFFLKMQKLKEVPNNAPKNVTNALFVGSTSELQKMLKGK